MTSAHPVTKWLKLRRNRFQAAAITDMVSGIQRLLWFRRFVREGVHT
jgi:hypothetical protein